MSFFTFFYKSSQYYWEVILFLSGLKFSLVAFHFMELKKANSFWKIAILLYIVLFITVVIVLE
jgi:hypothetical protein